MNSKKHIVFRADSGNTVGTGHISRCLNLAAEFNSHGWLCEFILRPHEGHLGEKIKSRGFQVHYLSNPAKNSSLTGYEAWLGATLNQDANESMAVLKRLQPSILVLDHYGIDARWEDVVRPYTPFIVAIDDLANRPHDCDVLIDQNCYSEAENPYEDLIPKATLRLIGPRYSLFSEALAQLRKTQVKPTHNLIFYGGADPTQETIKALNAIEEKGLPLKVVVGAQNPALSEIQSAARIKNIECLASPANFLNLMHQSYFAFGAGGVNMLERCFLGIPSLVTIVADNQLRGVKELERRGAVLVAGEAKDVTPNKLMTYQKSIESQLTELSKKARAIFGDYDEYGCRVHFKEITKALENK